MGLADKLENRPSGFEYPQGAESPLIPEEPAPAKESLATDENPDPAIAAVEAEILATETPVSAKSPEDQFAAQVSELLLTDDLYSYLRHDKQAEFPEALNKFIIDNFYHDRLDEKLDQEKLGKALLGFYMNYLDDVNEFFAAQAAFKDANKLLAFFKTQS